MKNMNALDVTPQGAQVTEATMNQMSPKSHCERTADSATVT